MKWLGWSARQIVLSAVLFVAIVLGYMSIMAVTTLMTRDSLLINKEFDKIQIAFEQDPSAFAGVVEHVERLKAAHPGIEQLSWASHRLCITGAGGTEVCTDVGVADKAAREPLPHNVSSIRFYAKDPDRIFLVFNAPEHPIVHAMYAPLDDDPGDFAKERGFGPSRELGDGWTLLGPIDDRDANAEQFPAPQFPDYS